MIFGACYSIHFPPRPLYVSGLFLVGHIKYLITAYSPPHDIISISTLSMFLFAFFMCSRITSISRLPGSHWGILSGVPSSFQWGPMSLRYLLKCAKPGYGSWYFSQMLLPQPLSLHDCNQACSFFASSASAASVAISLAAAFAVSLESLAAVWASAAFASSVSASAKISYAFVAWWLQAVYQRFCVGWEWVALGTRWSSHDSVDN